MLLCVIETISSSSDSIIFSTIASDSGQYSVQIVNDSTGCISNDGLIIDPNTMTVNILTIINPSSLTSCDGQISIDVLGGIFPYTISWDTLGGNFSPPTQPFGNSNMSSILISTSKGV